MSFNFIYNPLTNDKYSIFSYEGKSLLKQYIKEYQTGGSGSESESRPKLPTVSEAFGSDPIPLPDGSRSEDGYPKGLKEFVKGKPQSDGEEIQSINMSQWPEQCESFKRKLKKCEEENDEKNKKIEELESELQTVKAQSESAKDVEEKENYESNKPEEEEPEGNPRKMFKFEVKNNTFIMNQIEVKLDDGNKLGDGGSKVVYKIELDKEIFALAKIPKDGLNNKELQNEINCLKNLDHPNIAKLYGDYEDKYFRYLLMEYGESDLTSMRGLASENVELTRKFITNMASAISYLKTQNINHRDIKLENFIIVGEEPNQVVKLIDFGISTRCPGTSGYSIKGDPMDVGREGSQQIFIEGRGTMFYVAPENLKNTSTNTHKGDIFALGLCIFELFYDGKQVNNSKWISFPNKVNIRIEMTYPLKINNERVIRILETKLRDHKAKLNIFKDDEEEKEHYNNLIKETNKQIEKLKQTNNSFTSKYKTYDELYQAINDSVFGGETIIEGMLEYNPKKRIKIDEVLEALGSPVEVEGGGGGAGGGGGGGSGKSY